MPRTKLEEPIDREFQTEVALGNVQGYQPDLVIGVTLNQNKLDGFRTIWDHDAVRVPLTTATTLYINSTNAADTDIDVIVTALDPNLNPVNIIVNLNGLTTINLGSLRFVYAASMAGPNTPLGDVFIGTEAAPTLGIPADANVVSRILQGFNITHNAFFMIPKGKVGMITGERFSTNSNTSNPALIRHEVKIPGIALLYTIIHSVSQASAPFLFATPIATTETLGVLSAVFPEGSEVMWSSEVEENNTSVFFGADFLLVDANLATLRE